MESAGGSRARFLTTRWSLVRGAGRGSGVEARAALEELCRIYWYPLYAYVRRGGRSHEDARDLVQGFFAHFLEKKSLGDLDESGGRFRSYLLGALRHHVSNELERSRALKRGGGAPALSFELEGAEERYGREPADPATPERLYQRKWALCVLERALARLREEQHERGRGAVFERLRTFLVADEAGESLAEAARALELSENAAHVAIHRLRRRYRELLLAEVAQIVDRPQDVEDELRELFESLGNPSP